MINEFIPVANPKAQYLHYASEIDQAIKNVVMSGHYILGPEVEAFEGEFAGFIGTSFCHGVASGTDALAIALRACGVNNGDEVITVSHTAVATVAAIEMAGAIPVFADIDPESRCINPDAIESLISAKTKAVVPVHIYGQPAAMNKIMLIARAYNLKVVEDCCQAHGASIGEKKVGSFGDAAAFSFYPTKNLGALGDGGAVVTSSEEISRKVKMLQQYGWEKRYISSSKGVNSRLDELQAAVLRIKLRNLDQDNHSRIELAGKYSECIKSGIIVTPSPVINTKHVMHLYVVESENRHELARFLAERNIGTAIHYPLPIHKQDAYAGSVRGENHLPNTSRLYETILSLPIYPELKEEQVTRVCSALIEWQKI
ncbi:MAG: DegT/DnrJ/EryC1/StrS family aminotransferase [Ignavibacteria bacterium]|jgi:dTDP-4-amino-4,6-dideoxygalactose transaminase|nr:DegT/DnrJ/EryC1/StrS family aminotransferase [Ignavibacteria bacterium]